MDKNTAVTPGKTIGVIGPWLLNSVGFSLKRDLLYVDEIALVGSSIPYNNRPLIADLDFLSQHGLISGSRKTAHSKMVIHVQDGRGKTVKFSPVTDSSEADFSEQ